MAAGAAEGGCVWCVGCDILLPQCGSRDRGKNVAQAALILTAVKTSGQTPVTEVPGKALGGSQVKTKAATAGEPMLGNDPGC